MLISEQIAESLDLRALARTIYLAGTSGDAVRFIEEAAASDRGFGNGLDTAEKVALRLGVSPTIVWSRAGLTTTEAVTRFHRFARTLPCRNRRTALLYSGLGDKSSGVDFALEFAQFAKRHPLRARWSLAVGECNEICGSGGRIAISIDNETLGWLNLFTANLSTRQARQEALQQAGDLFSVPCSFHARHNFQVLTVGPD